MSDSDPKWPSIPQWQRQHQNNTPSPPSSSSSSPNSDSSSTADRAVLLEQATKFLQDDSLRDASTDRKISFLESKGLRDEEIQSLLGVSRNTEATSDTPSEDPKASSSTPDGQSDPNAPEEASTYPSGQTTEKTQTPTSAPPPAQTSSSLPSSSPQPPAATRTTSRDVPPIITYPEFLFKEPEKPPLVSFRGVLYTLYGVAGLGACLYGASEYFVKPMIANLSTARHDLADKTSENLKKLNEKLEQSVSTIPPDRPSADNVNADGEDADSVTSDPTELFHRDVATQTSPEIDQAASSAPAEKTEPDLTAAVSTHTQRLETIRSHLTDFAASEDKSTGADDSMRLRLNEMQHYLDGLMYSKPSFTGSGYGMYTAMDTGSGAATGVARAEEDAIASFKAEIRGVKGALLSARNFPSSRSSRISSGVPLSR